MFIIQDYGPCLTCNGTGKAITISVTKKTKYICVNGPQEGLRFTTDDMPNADPNYILYNSNAGGEEKFKCVWDWENSLNER